MAIKLIVLWIVALAFMPLFVIMFNNAYQVSSNTPGILVCMVGGDKTFTATSSDIKYNDVSQVYTFLSPSGKKAYYVKAMVESCLVLPQEESPPKDPDDQVPQPKVPPTTASWPAPLSGPDISGV